MSCIKTAGWVIALVILGGMLAGCSTASDQSDVPWNVPQPWEGTPTLPGATQ